MESDLSTPEERERVLLSAIINGNLDEVKYLVGVKHYCGVGMPLWQSALNSAVVSGNVEIAKVLRAHGHHDNGMVLYNAINSRSLPMFRFVVDDLCLKFESRFFGHALELDWIAVQDDDLLRAILDKANESGYLEWYDFNGFSGSTEDLGGDDVLLYSISRFLARMIGTAPFFYTLDIMNENSSGMILFGKDEPDYSLLELSIENNDLKSFQALWDILHRFDFSFVEKEQIDNYPKARMLVNKLFKLASDRGCKGIFEYLTRFADPL